MLGLADEYTEVTAYFIQRARRNYVGIISHFLGVGNVGINRTAFGEAVIISTVHKHTQPTSIIILFYYYNYMLLYLGHTLRCALNACQPKRDL